MPIKYQKSKRYKKKFNNKTVRTTAGREVPKSTQKISKNCQTFKEAAKRPKGAKKSIPKSKKKVVFIPKNHQKSSLPNS